ncbi:DoxX family protein [soil metagenome]
MKATKATVIAYWIFTCLFTLQMGFTAYAQLRLPQVAATFTHLGFPDYFRIELSWAKIAGLIVLVVPQVPARLKEWAYAGFTIVLVSALMAHLAVGDGVASWIWAVGTFVLEAGSYFFYRKRMG